MTTQYHAELTLPAAGAGAEDALPLPGRLLENPFELRDEIPEAIARGASFGRPASMHPYLIQHRYTRERRPMTLPAIVLDNEHVRATFIPALGGRLWSLVATASGRELLHVHRVLQPANLALRNAWFAGGVEWNIGTKGHAAHTMAPLHAAQVSGPGGSPMLRMWELDRLRQVVFQVDAWLPATSRALHVYVRIQNPNSHDVPMYWWSNAAVPEGDEVRVLAPAETAYATSYDGTLRTVQVPVHQGVDRTWTTRSTDAGDYFYDTSTTAAPWVAAVDSTGHGLAQVSTGRLLGRKLFLWGTGAGGQRWQQWLSPENEAGYLEIQAGLTATQFEHQMMPAGASWDWVEAYGDIDADPEQAHSQDWHRARAHAAQRVQHLAGDLDQALADARQSADREPDSILALGSGWGALEAAARASSDAPWLSADGATPFAAESLGAQQEVWHALLTDRVRAEEILAAASPAEAPVSYVVGHLWEEALTRSPAGWLRDYHLGVLAHARGGYTEADQWYHSSLGHATNAWALRGQALIATRRGDHALAADLLGRALDLVADQPTLLLEAMSAAMSAGAPEQALVFADAAVPELQQAGRVRLLEGFAALAAGHRDRAEALLEAEIVIPDLREGELALSDLWAAVHPDRPVPAGYDFRMREPAAE